MRLLKKDELIEELPMFLRPRDVSEALGVSLNYARYLFSYGTSFKTVIFGRRKYVSRNDFIEWLDSIEIGGQLS